MMIAWQQLFKVIWVGEFEWDPTSYCEEIFCLYSSQYSAQFHTCFLSFEVAISQTRVYCLICKDTRNICFPRLYSWSGHGAHVEQEFRKEHLVFLSVWSMTPCCRKKFLSLSKMTGPLGIQKGNVLNFLCQFCIDSTEENLLFWTWKVFRWCVEFC